MFFLTINNNQIQWLEVVSEATDGTVSNTLILRPYDYDPNSAKEPGLASNVGANLNFYLFDCESKKYYYLTQQKQQLIRYPLLVDIDTNIIINPGEILQQTQEWKKILTDKRIPMYPPTKLQDRKIISDQCKPFITQLEEKEEEKKAEAIAIFDQRFAKAINTKDVSTNSIAESKTNIELTQDYIKKVKQLYQNLKQALRHETIQANRKSILVNLTFEEPEMFCAIVIALLKDDCSPHDLLNWGVLGNFFVNHCNNMAQIQTAYSCLTTLAADPEFTILSLSINKLHALAKGHNIRERGFEKYALDGSDDSYRVEIDPITKLSTIYSNLPEHPELSRLTINLTGTEDNIAALHQAFGNVFLAIALSVENDHNFEALKPFLVSRVYTTPGSIEQFKEFAIEQLSNPAFCKPNGRRLYAILSKNETVIKSLYQHPQCGIVIIQFDTSHELSHEEITKLLDILIITKNNLDAVFALLDNSKFNQYKQRLMEAAADFLSNLSEDDDEDLDIDYTNYINRLDIRILQQWAQQNIDHYCQELKSLIPNNYTSFTKANFISLKDHYHLHYRKAQFLTDINPSLANTYPNAPDVFDAWVMMQLIPDNNTNNDGNIANQIQTIMSVIFEHIDTVYEPDQQIIARLRCLKHCPGWLQGLSIRLIVNPNNLETIITLAETFEFKELKQYVLEAAVSRPEFINIIHQLNERNETLWHRLHQTTTIDLVSLVVARSPQSLPEIIKKFNQPNIDDKNVWFQMNDEAIMALFNLFVNNNSTLFSDIFSAFNHQQKFGASVWRNFITKPKIILELVQLLIKKEVISAHHIIDAINKPNNQNNTGWHLISSRAITDLAQLFADISTDLLSPMIEGINHVNTIRETAWHQLSLGETAWHYLNIDNNIPELFNIFAGNAPDKLQEIITAFNQPNEDGNSIWHKLSIHSLTFCLIVFFTKQPYSLNSTIEEIWKTLNNYSHPDKNALFDNQISAILLKIIGAFNQHNKDGNTAWHLFTKWEFSYFITLVQLVINHIPAEKISSIIDAFNHPNKQGDTVWHTYTYHDKPIEDLVQQFAEKSPENLPKIIQGFHQPNKSLNTVWHKISNRDMIYIFNQIVTKAPDELEEIITAFNQPNKDDNSIWHQLSIHSLTLCLIVFFTKQPYSLNGPIEAIWKTPNNYSNPDKNALFDNQISAILLKIIGAFNQPNEDGNTAWHLFITWEFSYFITLVQLVINHIPAENISSIIDAFNHPNKQGDTVWHTYMCNAQSINDLVKQFAEKSPENLPKIIRGLQQPNRYGFTVWRYNGVSANMLDLFEQLAINTHKKLPEIVDAFTNPDESGKTLWQQLYRSELYYLTKLFAQNVSAKIPEIIMASSKLDNENKTIWWDWSSETDFYNFITDLIQLSPQKMPNIGMIIDAFNQPDNYNKTLWHELKSGLIIKLVELFVEQNNEKLPSIIAAFNHLDHENQTVWHQYNFDCITDLMKLFIKQSPSELPTIINTFNRQNANGNVVWHRLNANSFIALVTLLAETEIAGKELLKIINAFNITDDEGDTVWDRLIFPKIHTCFYPIDIISGLETQIAEKSTTFSKEGIYFFTMLYFKFQQRCPDYGLVISSKVKKIIQKKLVPIGNLPTPNSAQYISNKSIDAEALKAILYNYQNFCRNTTCYSFFGVPESTTIANLQKLVEQSKESFNVEEVMKAISNVNNNNIGNGTKYVISEIYKLLEASDEMIEQNDPHNVKLES